ncbi:MAG: O-antigen ligase family protein [Sedimentisphaerales bacterium]|nr:O-antigen ligase family protein [Sedimentisphaerales bacterium]
MKYLQNTRNGFENQFRFLTLYNMNEQEVYSQDELLQWQQYRDVACRNDGWWAAFFLFAVLFGPMTPATASLPPFRFADFLILFLLFFRWTRAYRFCGGYLFSNKIRFATSLLFILSGLLLFSTLLGLSIAGRTFFVKDLYASIAIVRMALIAAIVASFQMGPRQIRQFALGIVVLAFLTILLAFMQKYYAYRVTPILRRFYGLRWELLEASSTGLTWRVGGVFGNPNLFSLSMVILAASSLTFAIVLRGILRWICVLVFVGLVLSVMFTTSSRTGLITFVLISLFILLFSMQSRLRLPTIVLLIFVCSLFWGLRANIDKLPVSGRIKQIMVPEKYGGGTMTDKMAARFGMWRDSLNKMQDSPIIGVGMSKMERQTTDNGYIIILLRTGIIGLIIYLWMLLGFLFKGVRNLFVQNDPYRRALLLISVSVVLSHMLFDITADFFWDIRYSGILSIFIGLLCSQTHLTWLDSSEVFNHQEEYPTLGAEV